MKQFLFLYPISEYFNREIADTAADLHIIQRLNEIIDTRYRQSGYRVNWLLFSAVHNASIPNLSLLDRRILMRESDKIFPAGVSREQHRHCIYPPCGNILSQLKPVSELVIGGFHQIDCVDKIARAAHHDGVTVTVDEDTTDQFFKTTRLQCLPPIVRTREEYARGFRALLIGLANKFSCEEVNQAIREHRKERKNRPWLVQI